MSQQRDKQKIALVLPGGGARGSYQVGVLKGIMQIIDKQNCFPIITGTSAGAINATVLASYADDLSYGVARLEKFWTSIHCHDVYRTDARVIAKTIIKVFGAILFSRFGVTAPRSLLDNSPLTTFLTRELNLAKIADVIASGNLDGVAITASSYDTSVAKSFYQGISTIKSWHRTRRLGVPTKISVEHILASAALPFLFPAQLIGNEYYGDGGLRMLAPLSPAIHLGAEKIMVIGTRDENPIPVPDVAGDYPSMGELGGYMLDTIFMDTLMGDLSRLNRINETISLLGQDKKNQSHLRPIDTMIIKPSVDVRGVTEKHAGDIPRPVRTLLKMIGGWGKDWRMPSYLLFEPPYTKDLIALGYQDAIDNKQKIADFFSS